MVVSTATFLAAGRFGLAPTVNRSTSAGLKFQEVDAGLASGDPAGTFVDSYNSACVVHPYNLNEIGRTT